MVAGDGRPTGGDRGWMLLLHAVVRRVREFVGQVNPAAAAAATLTITATAPITAAAAPAPAPAPSASPAGVERLGGAQRHGVLVHVHLVVAAQIKIESILSYFSFKRLVPGAFNLDLIG